MSTYGLDDFCGDLCTILRSHAEGKLTGIAANLQRLLANPAFVAATFDDSMPPGKRVLFHDPITDVYVLAHVHAPSLKPGLPHSHGLSWAVYGNAKGTTEMTVWQRRNDESDAHAELAVIDNYALREGEARPYPPGVLHSTNQPAKAWVVRVTGTDLDVLPRYRFNRNTDKMLDAPTGQSL